MSKSGSRRLVQRARVFGFLGLIVAAVTGCASGPVEPKLGSGESYDGLREVTNAKISGAWIVPDLDLSGYRKILPVNVGVQYRPTKPTARGSASSRTEFPVPPEARAKFEALVTEIFHEELTNSSRFEIAREPGPDVLLLVGGVFDVVSNVPPEPMGRNRIYLSQVGEASLVLELRDSESNATLARLIDRRAADKLSGITSSSTVTNNAEIRRLLRYWATRLREALDRVPTLTPAND